MIQTEISAIYKKPKAQGKNGNYAYYLSAHVCKLVCYTLKKKATKFGLFLTQGRGKYRTQCLFNPALWVDLRFFLLFCSFFFTSYIN